MGVARCGGNVAVVQQSLHQFQIARVAQNLGREIVPEVVEPEPGNSGFSAQFGLHKAHIVNCERIALAANRAAPDCSARHERKDVLRMMPLQRP